MKILNINTRRTLSRGSLIIAVIMSSSGIFAQNSIKSFDARQYSANLFRSSDELIAAHNSSKEKKAFYEEEILLEDWMTDLEDWMENIDSYSSESKNEFGNSGIYSIETIKEKDPEMKNRTIDYDQIKTDTFTEQELVLEDWMKYPENWTSAYGDNNFNLKLFSHDIHSLNFKLTTDK